MVMGQLKNIIIMVHYLMEVNILMEEKMEEENYIVLLVR